MKNCPGCSIRLGPIRLLFQTKYSSFACFACGATLAREFEKARWIAAVGVAFLNDKRRARRGLYHGLTDDYISPIELVSPVDAPRWDKP